MPSALRPNMPAARIAAGALTAELDAMGCEHVSVVEDPRVGVVRVYENGELYGAAWSVTDEGASR